MFQDRWHAYELVSVREAWNGEIRRARKLQVIFFLKIRALVALRAFVMSWKKYGGSGGCDEVGNEN